MKRMIFLFLLLTGAFASFAQVSPVKFKTLKYSFGNIKLGVPATTKFDFTNISDRPVVIEVATADCGCTSPDYPQAPILKGKTADIKVTYNAEAPGHFDKKITVKFANVAQPVILEIDGNVVAKDAKG